MAKVLILGGGFGGLAAAHELRQRLGSAHELTLVANDDRFFVGYAKLWDLVGARPLAQGTRRLSGLNGQGVRFVHAQVDSIDPERRAVDTTAGSFDGDYMIVALGSAPGRQKLGSTEHGAHDLYDASRLPAMRAELEQLEQGRAIVAVLGAPYVCPPAPYEAGFLIEEHLRHRGVRESVEVVVTTPMPSPLPMAGSEVENAVADRLAGQGIDLRTGQQVSYCFLEFNGQRAAALEGEFFTKPKPKLWMAEPNAETYSRKQAFETERLQAWLGASPRH